MGREEGERKLSQSFCLEAGYLSFYQKLPKTEADEHISFLRNIKSF